MGPMSSVCESIEIYSNLKKKKKNGWQHRTNNGEISIELMWVYDESMQSNILIYLANQFNWNISISLKISEWKILTQASPQMLRLWITWACPSSHHQNWVDCWSIPYLLSRAGWFYHLCTLWRFPDTPLQSAWICHCNNERYPESE